MITDKQSDILAHSSQNDGRYVASANDAAVMELAALGMMRDFGPWALADGDHALRMTMKGREALSEYRQAQPKPKPAKRKRENRAFKWWRQYQDAGFYRLSFPEFWNRFKEAGKPHDVERLIPYL